MEDTQNKIILSVQANGINYSEQQDEEEAFFEAYDQLLGTLNNREHSIDLAAIHLCPCLLRHQQVH